jgi:lantibiotic modifying enzyme
MTAPWRSSGLDLARELAAGAIWADGVCVFHGATAPESLAHPPRYRSTGPDLYEGTAGIARFLGRAAVVAGDDELRRVALGAVRHALAHGEGPALFTGGLGVGLVGLELAALLDEPDLVAPAVAAVDGAAAEATDGSPDLLVGSAGVVAGLVAAGRSWTPRAVELGHELLAAAVPDGPATADGPPLSWPLQSGSPVRLCGLAHGASGVAFALEALATADPDGADQWRRAARQARSFERAHYAPGAGSWADLRPPEADGQPARPAGHPHMWCHGSVGICAERLDVLGHDDLARADAVGGLAGARAHAERLVAGPAGPGAGDELNGSVCHGLAGLIDLFVDAEQVSGDPAWTALAGALADRMIDDARRPDGWRSGVPGGWPAPGLMLGRAGCGWALLRLADPSAVPSVWRPPVVRR